MGRQALRCIRCSACLNVCPVYARVGGHAYGSVYPGPIGAILTPQLKGIEGDAGSLPYASSLCGACGEVCPVKIEIPRLLTHLRAREVASRARLDPEKLTMRALFHTFSSRDRYERAQTPRASGEPPAGPRRARARAAAPRVAAPAGRGRTISLGARAAGRLDDVPRPAGTRARELPRVVAPNARADQHRIEPRTHSIRVLHAVAHNAARVGAGRPRPGRRSAGRAGDGARGRRRAGGGARADILHRIRAALRRAGGARRAAQLPHRGRTDT